MCSSQENFAKFLRSTGTVCAKRVPARHRQLIILDFTNLAIAGRAGRPRHVEKSTVFCEEKSISAGLFLNKF